MKKVILLGIILILLLASVEIAYAAITSTKLCEGAEKRYNTIKNLPKSQFMWSWESDTSYIEFYSTPFGVIRYISIDLPGDENDIESWAFSFKKHRTVFELRYNECRLNEFDVSI